MNRSMRVIEISSKFQQRDIDELYFCQLALQEDGYNIEDLLRKAENRHCDMQAIYAVLQLKNFNRNETVWQQRYEILNFARFFPKKNGFPVLHIQDYHILSATYTILLDGLPASLSEELTPQVNDLLH